AIKPVSAGQVSSGLSFNHIPGYLRVWVSAEDCGQMLRIRLSGTDGRMVFSEMRAVTGAESLFTTTGLRPGCYFADISCAGKRLQAPLIIW
ncbi:MAG: hypothetical protein HQK83_05450, partial [Fibrobacteria bacterium]|nr:hypothetical protein [Fibrobacteria bacterium]